MSPAKRCCAITHMHASVRANPRLSAPHESTLNKVIWPKTLHQASEGNFVQQHTNHVYVQKRTNTIFLRSFDEFFLNFSAFKRHPKNSKKIPKKLKNNFFKFFKGCLTVARGNRKYFRGHLTTPRRVSNLISPFQNCPSCQEHMKKLENCFSELPFAEPGSYFFGHLLSKVTTTPTTY